MAAEPAMLKRVLIPSPMVLPAPLTTVAPTVGKAVNNQKKCVKYHKVKKQNRNTHINKLWFGE
jgi:hypothetical protein